MLDKSVCLFDLILDKIMMMMAPFVMERERERKRRKHFVLCHSALSFTYQCHQSNVECSIEKNKNQQKQK